MSTRLLLLSLLLAGCGGAATLSPTFPDNRAEDLAAVIARVRAAPPRARPVAVGLTADPARLYAYDLAAGRRLWEQPVSEPRTAPYLAGDLVVIAEAGGRVVARRLSDGAVAFSVADDNLQLVGAAGEGADAAIVLSTGGGVGARSRVLLVRGGSVASQLALESPAGAPDVRGGLVFLPWGNQNISVLEAEGARELVRFRFLDGVVGHALAAADGMFFGQAGVGRLAQDPGAAGWFAPDVSELPGRPALFRNAYDPPPGPASASHRIRLVWHPEGGEGAVRMSDETLYLTFYRLVFGLAQQGLAARWVYEHPVDVVGAAARAGGVMLADAEGGLVFIGADGRPRWAAETEARPTVVTLRLDGFEPSGEIGPELPPLADQLLGAAQNTDARLVPGRAYAVRLLASQPDAGVTEHLIILCDEASLPADLRRAACDALGGRELGADAVLSALGRRASYLTDTRPPPVGALATAAARLGERRAVPLLLAHLRDPHTSLADLPALCAALGALGDRAAAEPLTDFLWLYHAENDDEALAAGLGAAARALVALSGPVGREEVQRVAEAPFTPPRIRAQLSAALAQPEPQAAAD